MLPSYYEGNLRLMIFLVGKAMIPNDIDV